MLNRNTNVLTTVFLVTTVTAVAVVTSEGSSSRNNEKRPSGALANCSTRSQAQFLERNPVVVGPLILVGATYTDPATVRRFGGNKFPALVRAGHRVTIELAPRTHRVARLDYGRDARRPQAPDGPRSLRDGHRVVTFVACKNGQRSGSSYDHDPVTFWSGFVMTAAPRCVPLRVWVDNEPAPRRVSLRMGVRDCP